MKSLRIFSCLLFAAGLSVSFAGPTLKTVDFPCKIIGKLPPDARPILIVEPAAEAKSIYDKNGSVGFVLQGYPSAKNTVLQTDIYPRVNYSGTYSVKQPDGTWISYISLKYSGKTPHKNAEQGAAANP